MSRNTRMLPRKYREKIPVMPVSIDESVSSVNSQKAEDIQQPLVKKEITQTSIKWKDILDINTLVYKKDGRNADLSVATFWKHCEKTNRAIPLAAEPNTKSALKALKDNFIRIGDQVQIKTQNGVVLTSDFFNTHSVPPSSVFNHSSDCHVKPIIKDTEVLDGCRELAKACSKRSDKNEKMLTRAPQEIPFKAKQEGFESLDSQTFSFYEFIVHGEPLNREDAAPLPKMARNTFEVAGVPGETYDADGKLRYGQPFRLLTPKGNFDVQVIIHW